MISLVSPLLDKALGRSREWCCPQCVFPHQWTVKIMPHSQPNVAYSSLRLSSQVILGWVKLACEHEDPSLISTDHVEKKSRCGGTCSILMPEWLGARVGAAVCVSRMKRKVVSISVVNKRQGAERWPELILHSSFLADSRLFPAESFCLMSHLTEDTQSNSWHCQQGNCLSACSQWYLPVLMTCEP